MSDEPYVFISGTGRQDDAGNLSSTLQMWSTWDPVIAAAVVQAMRSLLGDAEEEMLLGDAACRALHNTGIDGDVVVLKGGDL